MATPIELGFRPSPQQLRVWRLENDGLTSCASQCALRIEGDLDRRVLRQALTETVARHEILRTAFRLPAGLTVPLQVILEPGPVHLLEVDFQNLSPEDRPAGATDLLRALSRPPFALERGEGWRAALVWIGPCEHELLLALSAACADAGAFEPLAFDLLEAYARQRTGGTENPEPPLQYVDVAAWQNSLLEGKDTAEGVETWREHWREHDIDARISLPLPLEEREAAPGPFEPREVPLPLSRGTARALARLAEIWDCPLQVLVLTAWMAVIQRGTGRDEAVVGVLYPGRDTEELRDVIGPLARYLPVTARFSPEAPLREAVARIRQAMAEAESWGDYFSWDHVTGNETGGFPVCFEAAAKGWELAVDGLRVSPAQLAGSISTLDSFSLALSCHGSGEDLQLTLRYDPRRFRRETANRLAGRLAALVGSIAVRPETSLTDHPAVAEEELRYWLELSVAPPAANRDWESKTLHAAFAEQADCTPDRIAVVAGDRHLTFRELDVRANRLAHHLRAAGAGPEVPVALCLERSAEAVVAILAVWKTGASYVPLDPTQPAERLAYLLADTEAPLLVTDSRLAPGLPGAGRLPGVRTVRLDNDAAAIALRPADRPAGGAFPHSLAYSIYTSGSTGWPKGVQVEHRSALHLLATLEAAVLDPLAESGLRPDPLLVSLNAPMIFDASVQQLVLLLAGHALCVVPEDIRADGAALLGFLREQGVDLLDCTPSQLRLLVNTGLLEDPADPCIVLTAGEALDKPLWRRLAQAERTVCFNLYGPTECSVDATFHRIEPGSTRPIIGRPLAGYEAFVFDRALQPVPPGAPGELCLGGAGLARGYLRRPALTAERFVPHPFARRPGERLYRTGDLGLHLLPDGGLEFLGRLDHQVKIRGFRIELGEIEAVLGEQAGVREAVVVARESETGDRRLIAYVAGDSAVDLEGALRRALRERLPDYMVPSAFVVLPALPLTPSGKVDRKALPAPEQPGARGSYVAPRTREEEILAAVWAQVLRLPRVGVNDNFFELGGDSILSVQIVARARQAGLLFTVRKIFEHQTVAELARHATAADRAGAARTAQEPVAGEVPLTPIQRYFFEQGFADPHHFNQALLLQSREPLSPAALDRTLAAILEHHDALRMRFHFLAPHGADNGAAGCWRQENAAAEPATPFHHVDLSSLPAPSFSEAFDRAAAALQAGFDLSRGPLIRLALFEAGADRPQRLLWVAHHLVVDGVSWRVLLEDLEGAYRQAARGLRPTFPPKTASFREWAHRLAGHAGSDTLARELGYWCETILTPAPRLPVDFPSGETEAGNLVGDEASVSFELSAEETTDLLQTLPSVYHNRIDDALLSALVRALASWTGSPRLRVDLEGHGREPIFDDLDVSRTVGWFTTVYPVVLEAGDASPGDALVNAKERLRTVPERGIGYGLLRHLRSARNGGNGESARLLEAAPAAEISFNYLGQIDATSEGASPFGTSRVSAGPTRSPRAHRTHLLDISGIVANGRFRITLHYGSRTHRRETAERLAASYAGALRQLIQDSRERKDEVFTASDFPKAGLDARNFNKLASLLSDPVESLAEGLGFTLKNVEDIYPLSPVQNGMLFHSLMAPASGIYVNQVTCSFPADLDSRLFRQAWERLVERHAVLRTAFLWEELDEAQQVVHKGCDLPWQDLDWRGLSADEQQRRFEGLRHRDRHTPLTLSKAPLMRFSLIRLDRELEFIWTFHHLLLDGWSLPVLVQELGSVYTALQEDREPALPPARPFSDYIGWLQKQDPSRAEPFWREELAGFTVSNPLGIDHPVGTEGASGYAEHSIRVSREVTAALQALAARHKLTLQTVTLGAWAVLVSRYSGEEDVVFGNVVSGRPAALSGVETMIGMFINTLPVRVRVNDAEPLAPWLQRLQERQLARQEFEHSPLAQIQRWSDMPSGSPLFETLYVFENYPTAGDGNLDSLQVGNLRTVESTNYPITLILAAADQIFLQLTYDRARVDEDAAPRALHHLVTMLAGMAEADRRVGELGLLTAEEALQLRALNETAATCPLDRPLHAWIEERAGHSPETVAIACEGEELTYGELNRRANRLARHLRALGAGPEARVAILMERSAELVVALLAVLKAGGAYVPLDPAYPAERIAFLLADSGASVLVTEGNLAGALPPSPVQVVWVDADRERIAALPAERLAGPDEPHPDGLAYIIYTSGSTGLPKGVQVTHANVLRLFAATEEQFAFGPADAWTFFHSAAFDFSVWEIWGALLHGGRLVVVPYEVSRSPDLFLDLLVRERVTVLSQTPSAFAQLARVDEERGGAATDLRLVIFGGETLDLAGLAPWFARHGDERPFLVNMYGITETTVHVTVRPLRAADARKTRSLIGTPLPDLSLTVMDPGLRPAPLGVPGELAVGGAGLARGYLGRPELTAERFVPDPLGQSPGARLYRSGDLGRHLPQGEMEYLGRIDHQVKIRGFRIELGEIETLLAALPGVREAVVVAREDHSERGPADRCLVAYVVGDVAADALRRSLRERLPDYMVPAAFVTLAALPRTLNRKVDRKALPAPEWQGTEGGHLAPRTPVEEILAGIWAEVLGLERVGPADDFFDLGGHSLLAVQVMSRLRGALGVEMPLRDLFEAPALAELAARVETALRASAGRLTPPLVPVPREGPLPLSFAQQRLWFIDQLEPGSPLYNIPAALRAEGPLDAGALARSLGEIVRRHEALRTVFAVQENAPVQRIQPPMSCALPVVDLSGLPEWRREAAALSLAGDEAASPFDLARGPLLRGLLVRLAEQDHVAALTMHHIASDGWSMGILVREIGALYAAFSAGEPSPLPELPVQYADVAVWQRSWLCGEILENEISFWRRQLAGLPPLLNLPTDHPRPALQSFRGSSRPVRLPAGLTRQIEALSRHEGTTLFMVLLAGFQALLARYSGQDDLAVGSPVAGRNRIETEGLIGFFVNTLVLRGDLSGAPTFRELLGRVRETALAAYLHQDVPFEKLVEELAPERSLGHAPLFQVMFALQNAPVESLEIRNLHLRPFRIDETTAKFDLTVSLAEHDGGLAGTVQYAGLFEATTIDRWIGHFERLLAAAATTPERRAAELELLSATELHQVVAEWNDTAVLGAWEGPVSSLVECHSRERPGDPAVVDAAGGVLTYGELDGQAGRMAGFLQTLGVGPETVVGVLAESSPELIVGLLAILKAGAAYVPLDPSFPAERLRLVLAETASPVVLTQESLCGLLPNAPARILSLERAWDEIERLAPVPAVRVEPESLAYVIYTSGSTGRPKGVQVPHRGLMSLVNWDLRVYGTGPGDRRTHVASLGFDASVWEIWPCLASGAALHLPAKEARLDPQRLVAWMAGRGITVSFLPTPLAEALLASGGPEIPALRKLLVGGDRLRLHPDPSCTFTLVNHYGPTEASVVTSAGAVPPQPIGEVVPFPSLGRPIDGLRVHLMDRSLLPMPPGVPGELWVGGPSLARGYLRDPSTTAERFVPDLFGRSPGERLYRTGDLCRHRRDGSLEFLGRVDHQIKIRGFRIEPGEIEAVLVTLPGVREAAVVVHEDQRESVLGDRRLVAYVVGDMAPEALRRSLRERLPDYMVPATFVTLPALPLTPNGKVDRKALPAPQWQSPEESYLVPRTPIEEILAEIWAEVLGLERIGAADHFFNLGGHSLLATRVMSRLRSAFGVELPLRDLFEAPTLADFAARVEVARRSSAAVQAPPLVPVPREGPLPLSFAQQRLWLIDQLEPVSPLYNMPVALRVEGPLDAGVLALCLGEIVRRHEALRTVFAAPDGLPVQVIRPAAPFALPEIDLSGLPEGAREAVALRRSGEEAVRPFDLACGPLLRGVLLRLAEGDHIVLLNMHHIISDGWSMGILVREIAALYPAFAARQPSPLAELPVQYADFAVWQRSWLHGELLETEIAWWRRQLAGLPSLLELPTDRPRPTVQSYRGATRPVRLPAGLTRQLEALARREGATLFMVLLAAFQALLTRYSGQEDLAVGTPIAGRNRVEIEELIGFFVNTLVLRGDLTGAPMFRDLLGRVRETALAAYLHQDVPFEKLVEELAPERSLVHSPLFQVMLALQNAPVEDLLASGLTFSPVDAPGTTAKFDLTLSFGETPEGLAGTLEYASDLFDPATAGRLLGHLANLLASAAADPGLPLAELRLMDAAEEELLRSGLDPIERAWAAPVTIHDLFTEQAGRTPDRTAAVGPQGAISYHDLAQRSAALADRIHTVLGGALDRPVALLADPEPQILIGMIAILQAGGGFVPLDPRHPEERLAWTLGDSGCEVLVTQRRHRDRAGRLGVRPVLCLEDALPSATGPARHGSREEDTRRSLAYAVYTSGSTGRPKGVQISHENLVPMLLWGREYFRLGEHTRVLQSLSFCFDFGIFEHLTTLLSGGTLVFSGEAAGDPRAFAREIVRHGINTLHTTPAFARELAVAEESLESLEILHLGGEALARDTVVRLREAAPRATVYNGYGPTEATVNSSIFRIGGSEDVGWPVVPIGRPSAENALYILDSTSRLVPFGVRGDLHVGGIGVARGYLNKPDLTAERFVPDPFGPSPGGRLYRTGDLVRYLPGGDIEFLGRLDDQVKIRGFRIELGEVEAVLASVAGAREVAVVAREDRPGDRRLVAYVVGDATADTLRQSLRARLPEHMVPAAFVTLGALPLTPNGKVDRQALPAPEWQSPGESYVAPRTPVEAALVSIWAQLLGLQQVGATDNFFDLGGHSLLATRVRSRVREAFGVELPLRTFFERPRLADLAAEIEALQPAGSAPQRRAIERADRRGPLPLSWNQQRFWFLHQLNPDSSAFNLSGAVRLSGRLDSAALEASFGEIVRRHSAVRTRIVTVAGVPHQIVDPPGDFVLSRIDLSGLGTGMRDRELRWAAESATNRPFDLAELPLQVLLLRLADDDHAVLFSLHHIAGDGWSMDILTSELGDLYAAFTEGRPSPLPEPPIQYADWVVAQQEWLRGPGGADQLAYWRRKLRGDLPVLILPMQRQRPLVRRFRGSSQPLILGAPLSAALADLARSTGSTLFMCLLAAFKALLHQVTGTEDLLVGTNVANREWPGTEGLIGLFVNDLALRTDLSGRPSFRELLVRVRETALEAYAHQDLPFEALQADLRPERSAGPLFQVLFTLQNAPSRVRELPGLTLAPFPAERRTANFDLSLSMIEGANGLSGAFVYDIDLFEASTIAHLAEHFVALLREVVSDPDRPLSSLSFTSSAAVCEMVNAFSQDL